MQSTMALKKASALDLPKHWFEIAVFTGKHRSTVLTILWQKTKEEHDIFKHLAFQIEALEDKDSVFFIFDVLCGKARPSRARHLLSEHLSELSNDIDTSHWSKSEHWVRWWSRDRILGMFCKAFTLRDSEDWDSTPNTNNPVESLNGQSSYQRGAQQRLCVTSKYIAWRQTTCSKNCSQGE